MKTEAVLGLLLVCMLAVVGGQSDNKLTSSESRDARRSARKQKNNGNSMVTITLTCGSNPSNNIKIYPIYT